MIILLSILCLFSASCLLSPSSSCPFLSAQAVFGISRPLQEPAGSQFASEPTGIWCSTFLWASQSGENAAGHGQPDCPAWMERPLPWLGAHRAVFQVSQWAFRGVLACGLLVKFCGCILQNVSICFCVAWACKLPTRASELIGSTKVNKSTAHYFQRYSLKWIKTQLWNKSMKCSR